MRREPRAVLFDLDDTLYPRRRFVLSGFAAISRCLERVHRIDASRAFGALVAACRRGERGREIQSCLDDIGLPVTLVPDLVALVRTHQPRLRLPASSRVALRTLRSDWRIGIVTNGVPAIQARKVHALGLSSLVDDVVYASEHGTKTGKPDLAPFLAALTRLGVPPHRAVFVGDDEICDVTGGAAAGLRTIRVLRDPAAPTEAEAAVRSVADVPELVERMIPRQWSRDVA